MLEHRRTIDREAQTTGAPSEEKLDGFEVRRHVPLMIANSAVHVTARTRWQPSRARTEREPQKRSWHYPLLQSSRHCYCLIVTMSFVEGVTMRFAGSVITTSNPMERSPLQESQSSNSVNLVHSAKKQVCHQMRATLRVQAILTSFRNCRCLLFVLKPSMSLIALTPISPDVARPC
jgi:hypothetical protein